MLAARKHVEQYYDGYLRSDDELHAVQTRNVALRWAADNTLLSNFP